jgi:hypothetical protein
MEILLLIAGRVQGTPKISFNLQSIGRTASNMQSADVSGPMSSNVMQRMVRPKLVSETTFEVVGLSDVDR